MAAYFFELFEMFEKSGRKKSVIRRHPLLGRRFRYQAGLRIKLPEIMARSLVIFVRLRISGKQAAVNSTSINCQRVCNTCVP
jgi:hypothetical protein